MFKLIKDNKIDIKELKNIINNLEWIAAPRVLGKTHKEHFYIGTLDSEDKKISIVLRPSMRLEVKETLKNRFHVDGALPEKDKKYRSGEIVDYSGYAKAVVDNKFLEHVKMIAKPAPSKQEQRISWD